ncbi:unnamed protein product [Malassezia sympodialis ATCC 42132]|uniref:Similar to S.cerevisiae protein NOP6 (rRNA-binding protein required for 40S ribosomal subunit biogenesis) n=1 Tax=Malassezia sympodialis (strain ATCC 42132) TaxID=1230383 RepID=M5E630_MALS4|nr:uncharacterized protein MSY001_0282 [Malassezia sympodialis ATCC 42132]CCU97576.1 unnamed protein product [Malassezia sympodialis ATCC 42132]SHO76997.1 Similar to S.cerevisiae protein NOP6 (rRNA-binding protein required for 40S ribosomal subunit biogenesis) [Malassezia sympodialis ATCC 42132]|eukprot:XP_018738924.1 uncharacterized protein MSY001_0282 [Malassezia sympodialis ATCC 42132]
MTSGSTALTKKQKKAAKFKSKRKSDDLETITTTDDEDPGEAGAEKTSTVATDTDANVSTHTADSVSQTQKDKEKASSEKPKNGNLRTVFEEDGTTREELVSKPPFKENGMKYIVFVGNMSFDVTADMLAKHLGETCGEVPMVRLLTKKADPNALTGLSNSKKKSIAKGKAKDPSAPVSKGCAFVEFTNKASLQKALRFHHTMFHGRQINVELTAGGGGKSQHRKEKIKAKNESLDKQRRKLHEKYVKPAAEEHKRKVSETFTQEKALPGWDKGQEGSRPPKRSKFASGANAVRLG